MAKSTLALFLSILALSIISCGGMPPAVLQIKTDISAKTIVFVGDSVTFFWSQTPEFRSHKNWTSKAVSGVSSDYVLAHFQQDVIDAHPDEVHILVGTNDVYPGWNLDGSGIQPFTVKNITDMIVMAHAAGIEPVISTIPPWGDGPFALADTTPERFDRINQLNGKLQDIADEFGISLIDYHSALVSSDQNHYVSTYTTDGVHPNGDGFVAMDKTLFQKPQRPTVKPRLP